MSLGPRVADTLFDTPLTMMRFFTPNLDINMYTKYNLTVDKIIIDYCTRFHISTGVNIKYE